MNVLQRMRALTKNLLSCGVDWEGDGDDTMTVRDVLMLFIWVGWEGCVIVVQRIPVLRCWSEQMDGDQNDRHFVGFTGCVVGCREAALLYLKPVDRTGGTKLFPFWWRGSRTGEA